MDEIPPFSAIFVPPFLPKICEKKSGLPYHIQGSSLTIDHSRVFHEVRSGDASRNGGLSGSGGATHGAWVEVGHGEADLLVGLEASRGRHHLNELDA